MIRTRLVASAALFIACAALVACGPARPGPDGGSGGGSGGSGGSGGGAGGGSGGSGGDGGALPETIAAAKGTMYPSHVALKNVVVTAVDFARASAASTNCPGSSSKGVNATFWVADQANAQAGIYVDKFRCDGDVDYFPVIGDVLDIEGMVAFESQFEERIAYRVILKSQFTLIPGKSGLACTLADSPPCQPLIIAKKGTMAALNDNVAPAGFGDAMGGLVKPNPQYGGARVSIAGPLSLTNANPPALKRVTANAGDTVHFGFEVTGGVLVNNSFTRSTQADGGPGCDWRAYVNDGGTVTFPNGIRGVWDTYSHTPCADGGTDYFNCFNLKGQVPGTPDANYTYVLYPMNCASDLQGVP
jgi:hypothetical protein